MVHVSILRCEQSEFRNKGHSQIMEDREHHEMVQSQRALDLDQNSGPVECLEAMNRDIHIGMYATTPQASRR